MILRLQVQKCAGQINEEGFSYLLKVCSSNTRSCTNGDHTKVSSGESVALIVLFYWIDFISLLSAKVTVVKWSPKFNRQVSQGEATQKFLEFKSVTQAVWLVVSNLPHCSTRERFQAKNKNFWQSHAISQYCLFHYYDVNKLVFLKFTKKTILVAERKEKFKVYY